MIPEGPICTLPKAVVSIDIAMKPMHRWLYKIPHSMKVKVTTVINNWVTHKVIEPAEPGNPWNWPLIAAPKKDNNGFWTDVYVCVDFKVLNNLLEDKLFTIPLISDLLQATQGFVIASTLDLCLYFNQLPVKPEDCPKTGFTWNNQVYQFAGALFGLKHLPKHAQWVLACILAPFHRFCCIFIDDIIIFSHLVEEHAEHLQAVLDALTSHGLKVSMTKSKFAYWVINYLGYLTDGQFIDFDWVKVSAFINLPEPGSAKQLHSVLSIANYLCEFIPLYSCIVAPLEHIQNVRSKFGELWDNSCKVAFHLLKKALSDKPLLQQPDFSKPFFIAMDALDTSVGAVLFQKENDSCWYIGFVLSALKPNHNKIIWYCRKNCWQLSLDYWNSMSSYMVQDLLYSVITRY